MRRFFCFSSLFVVLFGCLTGTAHAQGWSVAAITGSQPTTRQAARLAVEPDYVRNHGTGVRFGGTWQRPLASFEIGAFHQIALGKVGSVQAELSGYRQQLTATAPATGGLRLPVLLVLNPLDNVSLHFGPQVQWQAFGAAPTVASELDQRTTSTPTSRLTMAVALGAEARVEMVRVGARCYVPLQDLSNLSNAGTDLATTWRNGQVMVYAGVNINELVPTRAHGRHRR